MADSSPLQPARRDGALPTSVQKTSSYPTRAELLSLLTGIPVETVRRVGFTDHSPRR